VESSLNRQSLSDCLRYRLQRAALKQMRERSSHVRQLSSRLVEAADADLHQVKRNGRNQVVIA
jgi:1,2-phenylacetyl-CoA epoxidase catalytic subunit